MKVSEKTEIEKNESKSRLSPNSQENVLVVVKNDEGKLGVPKFLYGCAEPAEEGILPSDSRQKGADDSFLGI